MRITNQKSLNELLMLPPKHMLYLTEDIDDDIVDDEIVDDEIVDDTIEGEPDIDLDASDINELITKNFHSQL